MQTNWRMVVTISGLILLLSNAWKSHPAFAAENPEVGPAATRNPLRDSISAQSTRSLMCGLAAQLDLAQSDLAQSDLLQQLRAAAEGSVRGRAIVAIHRLRECGAGGAAILAQLSKKPNQPLEIHFAALNSLTEMGPAAVPALLDLLQPSQDSGRELAWQVLGRMGPQASSAVPMMIMLLRDTTANAEDRILAANLLERIGPPATDACDSLLETAELDQDFELRLACLHAMRSIGKTSPNLPTRLAKLLLKEDEETRLRVATAVVLVEQSNPPQVVLPALIGLAQNSDDWSVCIAAAEALGKLGPNAVDAVPMLTQLLEHEGFEVQLAAIAACGQIGSGAAEAIPALVHRIQHAEGSAIVESAATALIKIDPHSVDNLLAGLVGDSAAGENTLQALAVIGPYSRTAVPQLLKMLADPSLSELHLGIIQVLHNIGPDAAMAVPYLESRLTDNTHPVETRAAAALALGAINPTTAPTLLSALRDTEPTVRVAAAQALALQNIRERISIPVLMRELADADAAEAAMQALVAIGTDAQPVLQDLILDEQADLAQRKEACLILGRIGGNNAAPTLVRVLQHRDEELAAAAELALLELGPRTAVPALLDAIREREEAASKRPLSTVPSDEPKPPDSTVERMLQLITDLSGGLGGPGSASPHAGGSKSFGEFGGMEGSGTFGSAPPMADAPAAEAPPPPSDSAASESSSPRSIQPSQGARATGPMTTDSAADSQLDKQEQKAALKIVKVFYGTNRAALESADQRWHFVRRGFLPALIMGGVTTLFCAFGFAKSRSRVQAALAIVGVIATVCLAYPATQQASHSVRSAPFRPGPVFGSDPSDRLELGTCEVSIPVDHKVGELESPSILRLEFAQDPRKHIVLRDVTSYGEERFHAELKRNLAEKGKNILVFVHGYNVDFDNAARRTAQLACDLEFAGVPLFFSWPSQANWYEYRQDEKQVELAVPLLKRFLLEVASRSQANSIHLVAHSMGNRALTTALKEMESVSESHLTKFNQVVLAAPDIDADVFRQRIAPAIMNRARRVTLYASSNDLALTASRTFNSGDVRAGDTSHGLLVTTGIETIDVSAVDTSLLGHSYYGDNPTVLTDLKELLQTSHSADQRPFLQAKSAEELRYWVFQHPTIAQQLAPDSATR